MIAGWCHAQSQGILLIGSRAFPEPIARMPVLGVRWIVPGIRTIGELTLPSSRSSIVEQPRAIFLPRQTVGASESALFALVPAEIRVITGKVQG